MVDRPPSRFRFTPFGKHWRDFWFEVPEPFVRVGEWLWRHQRVRRLARWADRQGTGPQFGGYPIGIYKPGRREQLVDDQEYAIDDDEKAIELLRLHHLLDDPPATVESDVRRFFQERGLTLRIEKRRLHDEYLAAGDAESAAMWAPDRRYFCVDLTQDRRLVEHRYGVALTEGAALIDAQIRYIKEHG